MAKRARGRKKAKRAGAKLSAVPPGYRTVTPHLAIDGAAKAIEFYKRAFGAKELVREASPDGKLMHAALKIGDSIVMLADAFPQADMKAPNQVGTTTVALHIYSKDVDALFRNAVAAGAKVSMPLDDQFWGERYGKLVDPFGHHWSASMRIPMSRAEREMKRQQAMVMFEKSDRSAMEAD